VSGIGWERPGAWDPQRRQPESGLSSEREKVRKKCAGARVGVGSPGVHDRLSHTNIKDLGGTKQTRQIALRSL
jgi:hypothetical protein